MNDGFHNNDNNKLSTTSDKIKDTIRTSGLVLAMSSFGSFPVWGQQKKSVIPNGPTNEVIKVHIKHYMTKCTLIILYYAIILRL